MTDTGLDCFQHQPPKDFYALRALLTTNLINAMKAASEVEGDGRGNGLTDTAVHKRTGIARSTLRRLRSIGSDGMPRAPQLETLFEVCKQIGIPLPFLLMSPHDWQVLGSSISDIFYYSDAAKHVVGDKPCDPKRAALEVLHRAHYNKPEPQDLTNLRQRLCLILGRQMLAGVRTTDSARLLAALAASLANQTAAATHRANSN